MKIFFSIAISLLGLAANAQYYYKDIKSAQDLKASLKTLKDNNIKSVNIKSIEVDGTPSEGFFCHKTISKDYQTVELFTRAHLSSASLMTTKLDQNGNILSNTDSSKLAVSKSLYAYNEKGNITSISSSSYANDEEYQTQVEEKHIYQYDSAGALAKMFLLKPGKDTIVVFFATDENGNVLTELNTANNSYYYYYYDTNGNLTDIVLSTEQRPKPTPQYIFQYNNNNRLTQMTTIDEGYSTYTVWKYTYENKLVIREKCYINGNKLAGSIEYEYK